jgi:cyclopropane fatty-acyl-phospholipid synthase-like methyltransferase
MDDLGKLYKPELYNKIWINGYNFAKLIIPLLQFGLKIESILDIGSGSGGFLYGCQELGINDFLGVDGEHVKESLIIPHDKFICKDLKHEFDLKRKFDLIVTLEVVEHIEKDFEDNFFNSLFNHGDLILFSGAQEKQPGIHHVNCQSLEYWIKKFEDNQYKHIDAITNIIRQSSHIPGWYRLNTMLFLKNYGK